MLLDSSPPFSRGVSLAIFALGMLLSLTLVPQVLAHKVNVFAWTEGDTVFVEGYYPGGKKAQNSLVEVYSSSGDKLLEGRTDAKGEFSFEWPAGEELTVVLTAGMGHKNDFTIRAGDHGRLEPAGAEMVVDKSERRATSSSTTVEMDQLEVIIDQALDRKLEPVIQLIRESRREGPSVTEVIGGIGYIFGLFGLVMYFKSRDKKRSQESGVRRQER